MAYYINCAKPAMNSEESTFLNNDYKYKVVFLGDSSVGKTSLVDHIINGSCTATHQPTLCLQSAKKLVTHHNKIYKLMLWDTAGQEKFNSLIPSFVRGCDCAVIVYDVTNKESLANCQNWLKIVRNGTNQHEGIVLVANKTDLPRAVASPDGFELAVKNKIGHIEVSAKSGKGIEDLVAQIVESIERNKYKSEKETKSSEGDLNSSRKLEASKVKVAKPQSQIKVNVKNSCCSI